MRSVHITRLLNNLFFTVLLVVLSLGRSHAQENSPFTRYGWGNLVPSTPIATRGMAGLGAGYVDYDPRYDLKVQYPRSQTVNFLNPASYAKLRMTSFDIGLDIENQTLRQLNNVDKYKASFANISYVQLGIPLSRKHSLGMVFGLRPISRVNYNIQKRGREYNAETGANIDSTLTTYEGNGGSYQAYAGLGKSFGGFSVGVNAGYYFGSKDLSTRKEIVNDSVSYYKGNFKTRQTFGGLYLQGGVQYAAKLSSKMRLVVGGTATIKQEAHSSRDVTKETFVYAANSSSSSTISPVDSMYSSAGESGIVVFPTSYTAGFTLERQDKWLVGVDFSQSNWNDYRDFNVKDSVANNWKLKIGGQFVPNAFGTKYWGRVTYRLGVSFGPDYIHYAGKQMSQYNLSAGFGLPVRPNRFSNQYSTVNLALEYGKRGGKNDLLQESLFRLSVGFSLSDLWFFKKKYD